MTRFVNCYSENLKGNRTKRCLNLRVFNFFVFLLVFASGFAYLIGVSDLTVKSFALKDLKQERATIMEKKMAYEQEIDALQSYYVLNARVQSLNMVAINEIEYIKVPDSVVAKK